MIGNEVLPVSGISDSSQRRGEMLSPLRGDFTNLHRYITDWSVKSFRHQTTFLWRFAMSTKMGIMSIVLVGLLANLLVKHHL